MLNSCALAELGINRDSVPPAGGSYDRDADGDLTGIVREAAAMELMPRIMNAFSDDEIADAYRGFCVRWRKTASQAFATCRLWPTPAWTSSETMCIARLLESDELDVPREPLPHPA